MPVTNPLDRVKQSMTNMGTAMKTVLASKVAAAEKGAALGVPTLNNQVKIPDSFLNPDLGKPGPPGPSTYDKGAFINGKPQANEVMVVEPIVRNVTIPANFAGSYAFCTNAPTSTVVIEVLKNLARIGTITFGSGQRQGVFASTVGPVAINFVPSDEFAIRNTRADVDATFSDLRINILMNTTSV